MPILHIHYFDSQVKFAQYMASRSDSDNPFSNQGNRTLLLFKDPIESQDIANLLGEDWQVDLESKQLLY